MTFRGLMRPFVGLLLPVALVALWWFASSGSDSYYFPPLSTIWDRFLDTWFSGQGTADIWPTLLALGIGYVAGTAVGISLGTWLALSPRVYYFLSPLLEIFRAVPGIALIPIFVSALGIGMATKVALVVFGAVWPILINTIDGIRSQDLTVSDTARSYRLRSVDRIFRVVLPGASPQVVAGMKVALSLSVIVVIATEMVVSTEGIGNFLLKAQAGFDLVGMWSGLVLMGLIGYALNVLFELAERRALRWHRNIYERGNG